MLEFIRLDEHISIAQSSVLQGNAVIIDCGTFLMLIDSLLLPKDINELKSYLKSQNKPLKYLINTHWHSDHCSGNKLLQEKDTIIIAHWNYWETLNNEKNLLNPHKPSNIKFENYQRPHILINNDFCFKDHFTFKLICCPGHSFDSICIYIEELEILISGDTILGFPDSKYSIPYFYWGNEFLFIRSLKKIQSYNIKFIIPGHSGLLKSDIITDYLDYLLNLISLSLDIKASNPLISFGDLLLKIPPDICLPRLSNSPLWVPDMHKFNLERIFLTYFKTNNSL